MSDSPQTPTVRLVPGAPPPPPVSKSQKKKRKTGAKKSSDQPEEQAAVPDAHAAALISHAPSEADVKEGSIATDLVARTESFAPLSPGGTDEPKSSPLVEMLIKRSKATNKKISRIQSYSTTPVEKLNEDQLRTLKTLPVLEGIYKELEEVKKAVETHETELSQELANKKLDAAKEEEQRIQGALCSAANIHSRKTADLLSFITLPSALSSGNPAAAALGLVESETTAVFSAIEVLLGTDAEAKTDVMNGFLSGEGSFQDVPYSRFNDITYQFLNPRPQTPPTAEPAVVEFLIEDAPEETPDLLVGGMPLTIAPTANSFQFVQDDELEAELEQQEEEEEPADVEVTETITEVTVNGRTVVEDTVTVTTSTEIPAEIPGGEAGLNWADEDDGGLPSIASLHDKFGSSSTGTPLATNESLPETPVEGNGATPTDDGFQAAIRGRGRGRGGFRGDRGGFRGEYRGRGDRGGRFRGGERGGERSGHFRGGERGGRFRGGDRGEFRGGDRGGEFRGGYRRGSGEWRGGDDEHRGRGRGRGRGNYQEARGGVNPA